MVDRRSVRRRRECVACVYRFSTVEMLAEDVPKKVQQPMQMDTTPTAKPAVIPRKNPQLEIKMSVVKKNVAARRKIEDLRESRRVREYEFEEYEELPDSW